MRQAHPPLWIWNLLEKLPPPPKQKDSFVLKPSLPLGEFVLFACSYSFVVKKTRNEFSLHPRWEVSEGNLWKLKFVTVGRTVALQPRPNSGCTASQLHCKVLEILPPTPEYIYMYIKKIPCPSLSTQKDLITLQKQQYPLWSIKTNKQTKSIHYFFFQICVLTYNNQYS